MTTMHTFDEYTDAIRARARELAGQAVTVNLVGGQTLSGTLTYESAPGGYPVVEQWPDALTITAEAVTHTVRLDHVSSVGQG
ncbi:hypothetical protein [Streptomyces sp. NPDC004830]